MNQYTVKFEYKDEYSRGKWNSQECLIYANSNEDAIRRCIEIYGLDRENEVEYKIVDVIKR